MSMNESQFGTMDEPGDAYFVDLTVYGDENIAGDVVIGGNLSVTGASELILTETLMGDLIMGDAMTKGGNIQVYRDTSGNLGFNYQPGTSLALADLLSMSADYKVQFRDSAIHVESADDGHLDLTADTSIDLNAATVITGSYLSVGTNPAASGLIRIPNAQWIAGRNTANSGDVNIVKINAADHLQFGAIVDYIDAATTSIIQESQVTGDANWRFQIQADGKMLWGDGTNAPDTNLYRESASYLATEGSMAVYGAGGLTIASQGEAKANRDYLTIRNTRNAADMDGTESSISWSHYYYDASTPASRNSGRIGVFTESDWTSVASTQDASMRFSVAIDGVVTEVARLTSRGQLQLPNTGTTTAGILLGGDTNIYRGAANYLYTGDSFAVLGTYGIAIAIQGTAKAEHTFINLQNTLNAVDMDGTETTILFRQKYYDASSPQQVDAAKITFGTEGDWTSDVATQDGYLKFSVVVNGTVTERLRITSDGRILMPASGKFATEKSHIFTISGKDEIDLSSATDNTGGILSVFPNGTPASAAVETSLALYGTDYEADATNYSALYIEKWNAHADLGSNWVIRPAYGGSGTQLDLEIWQQRTGAGAAHQKLLSFKTVAGADCYTVLNKALLTDVATQIQFRDAAIHVESADDGHLDLTADTSIDLNAAISAGGILTMNGDYDIQFGNSASELLWYDGSSTYDVNLKRGGANLLQTDDTLYAALGLRTKEDSGDYNADWSGYTPPTGASGLIIAAHNTNGSGSDRLYWYAGSAWHYVAAA